MPVRGKMITAHQTRQKVLDLLEETQIRRRKDNNNNNKNDNERSMIVDISATTWNWDTYAIVAGSPSPVKLLFSNKEELEKYVPLEQDNDKDNDKEIETVLQGILVPQQSSSSSDETMVWVPKGAILKEMNTVENEDDNDNNDDPNQKQQLQEFVFECPIDPNDDRLEHWEQEVCGNKKQLYTFRAQMAVESMRNMMRFYNLDRILCWDLSWGMWEAIRVNDNDSNRDGDNDDDRIPKMMLVNYGNDKDNGTIKTHIPFPSSVEKDSKDMASLYDCCRPISPELLKETLSSVSGYYLVGGNTYTMSLFHHMWDQQPQKKQENNDDNTIQIGHMQLLRNKVKDGTLFYMGHSAGLIMSGPNILTATFKGIDAFSVVTQRYNAPYVRLPPSETPDTFFTSKQNKNNLWAARTKMLEKMQHYNAWSGYHIVEAFSFPHYDARPRMSSFPQSAETYLSATDKEGRFAQLTGSLLVGRVEPKEVTKLREETNAKQVPCYPVANGHAFVMPYGSVKVVETLSPVEEGAGILQWDTYMPYVPDQDYLQFAKGRTEFTPGSFTGDVDTIAGDRSSSVESAGTYNGARLFSRLEALGLPNPNNNNKSSSSSDEEEGGEADRRLFRSE